MGNEEDDTSGSWPNKHHDYRYDGGDPAAVSVVGAIKKKTESALEALRYTKRIEGLVDPIQSLPVEAAPADQQRPRPVLVNSTKASPQAEKSPASSPKQAENRILQSGAITSKDISPDCSIDDRDLKNEASPELSPSALDREESSLGDSGDGLSTATPAAVTTTSNGIIPHAVGAFPVVGVDGNPTDDDDDDDPTEHTIVIGGLSVPQQDDDIHRAAAAAAAIEEGRAEPAETTIALAVTRDDLEEEVRQQIMEQAPTAEVVNEKNRRQRQLFVLAILVAALLVAIIVPLTTQNGNNNNNNNNANDSSTEQGQSSNKKKGWVYVISNATVNWCGHNKHRANRCGGTLASINTPEEKAIVDGLKDMAMANAKLNNATTWGGRPIKGVWIGGEQLLYSRNDTGSVEEDIVWVWADGSPWFDGDDTVTDLTHSRYGNYWAPGEPNNTIDMLNNKTQGEHHVLLTPDGKYMDEHGCKGQLAPKGPGIYILPEDYRDFEKYPDCQIGLLLAETETTVPPRPDPEWVYVLSQSYHRICANSEPGDWATNCGGYRASITNIREKAIVDYMKDIAIEQAENEGRTDVDGVWIGADQSPDSRNNTSQMEVNVTWRWADGSAWFDKNGAYWADGQPDNVVHLQAVNLPTGGRYDRGEHYVMLNGEGKYEDTLDCSMIDAAKELPTIFMLPSDYTDRNKYPNCQPSTFTTHIPVPPRP